MLQKTRSLVIQFALFCALLAGIVAVAGHSPRAAAAAFLDGAVGSTAAAVLCLLKTAPLLWTGLGVALAFRTGAWNIGAEGQFYAGALAAAWVGVRAEEWFAPAGQLPGLAAVALTAGMAAGALWAAIAAALRVWFGVSEVLGTIMLNFIALELVSYAVHGPLKEAALNYPQSDRIAEAARFSRLFEGSRLHTGVLLAGLAVVLAHLFLSRTTTGFRFRAVGGNPEAARAAGISTPAAVMLAMALSGALAGAGGACEIQGVTLRLYERFSAGYGYTAIAVALMGGLRPGGVAASALFFGVLEAGAGNVQRSAGIPSVLVQFVQGAVLLMLLTRPAAAAPAREDGS